MQKSFVMKARENKGARRGSLYPYITGSCYNYIAVTRKIILFLRIKYVIK